MIFTRFVVTIVLLFPVISSLSACNRSLAAEQGELIHHTVNASTVTATDSYAVSRRFAGTLVASQQTNIGFELAGKIAKITVNSGDSVKKGQLLAQLDTELLRIERTQLEAQRAETQARLDLVISSLKRTRSLEQEGYASQQRLDELTSEQDSLNAALDRIEAGLASVNSRLGRATLRAPFDAIVSKRLQDVGTVVNAGSPVFRLLQQGGQEARVGVPNRFTPKLPPGSSQTLRINGDSIQGSVITLGADISPVTRTRTVRLALPANSHVIAGELIYLQLDEQIDKAGYWVPMTGLTDGLRGLWNVYTLKPEGEGLYRVEARSVRILYSQSNRAYIQGDLEGRDLIVRDGLHRIVSGQVVRLADAASNTANAGDQP
jgi:RND family efflux transporter MFP subunit